MLDEIGAFALELGVLLRVYVLGVYVQVSASNFGIRFLSIGFRVPFFGFQGS